MDLYKVSSPQNALAVTGRCHLAEPPFVPAKWPMNGRLSFFYCGNGLVTEVGTYVLSFRNNNCKPFYPQESHTLR